MLKKVHSYSEFIHCLFDDKVQVNFELIENEFSFEFNEESERMLAYYKQENPSAMINYIVMGCGFIEHEGFRVYVIHYQGLVYSKIFCFSDVHRAAKFRKLDNPWKIVYNLVDHTWASKTFHRHSKQTYTHPIKIENNHNQCTLLFSPQEKFSISKVIIDSKYKYIIDIVFSKNYSYAFRLSDISSAYPDIAQQLRFKVRSIDKFTTNNKIFREHIKILEMIAI